MIYNVKNKEKQELLEELMREHGIEFTASEYNYQLIVRSEIEFLIEQIKADEDRTPKEFSILADIENRIDDIVEEIWDDYDEFFTPVVDAVEEYLDNALRGAGNE